MEAITLPDRGALAKHGDAGSETAQRVELHDGEGTSTCVIGPNGLI